MTHPTDAELEATAAKFDVMRASYEAVGVSGEYGAEAMEEAAAMLRACKGRDDFQQRVAPWMQECFGPEISADKLERGDRFLEEAFELLQSGGYTPDRARALINYVWSRPIGEPNQEVGGVMVTLAAYCLAHDLDMHVAGETELERVCTKVDKIRAKQAAKPRGSALPAALEPAPDQPSRCAECDCENDGADCNWSAQPDPDHSDWNAAIEAVENERKRWFCGGDDCDAYDHGRDEGFELALKALKKGPPQ